MNLSEGDIVLKSLVLEDAGSLFALTDKNRSYIRQWLPWVDKTITVEDSKQFIQDALNNKNAIHFGIWYEGNFVGVIGYHYIDKANKKGQIGYWLDETTQKKGIMTKACRLVIAYGFEELNLNRVEISCATGNEKSCAIPERLGFQQEGTFREVEWLNDHFVDHKFYALLRKEWTA